MSAPDPSQVPSAAAVLRESLAGRIGLLSLLPFEHRELPPPLRSRQLLEGIYPALAARASQKQNKSSLSREIGVGSHTIDAWVSVLESSCRTFNVRPFLANLGKRLIEIKSGYTAEHDWMGRLEEIAAILGPSLEAEGMEIRRQIVYRSEARRSWPKAGFEHLNVEDFLSEE